MATTAGERRGLVRRSLLLCGIEGVLAMPLVYLMLPGNFVIAALLANALHLPADTYGLIVSLPFWCNFLQIFLTPPLTHRFAARTIVIASGWLHFAAWAALAAVLTRFPVGDPQTSGRWFFIFYLCSSFLQSINGVSWTTWVQEWVPERVRGKYFGWRNRILQLALLTFLLVAGELVDRWDNALVAFQWLFAGAVVLRFCSLLLYRRMHVGLLPVTPHAPRRDPRELIRLVLRAPSLSLFIAFGAAWGFAANSFGAFYTLFMFNRLELSATEVSFFQVIGLAAGALSLPGWGQMQDRFGNKPVMLVSFALWQTSNFLWCFLAPHNTNLLYFMWAWAGATGAGFVLGQFNLLLKLIPAEAKALAIGINLAVTSLVTAIAPIIGGQLLSWAFARGHAPLNVYHLAFLVQPVLGFASCLLLRRVQEPKSSPVGYVVGAMRNVRTLGAVFGLGFLLNYAFYRSAKRPPRTDDDPS
ncbi:MFS transporter [Horticoccus luteus]|uniref:MFS transporter n=1 Tax=Horticoccus luteus TaxID=2862869 RepID=A0A8F9XMD3_9BACT|nr:MFS transporter [Horticoccus luteus]QYM80126.1 MFS transporter [Horticoccus luteus]